MNTDALLTFIMTLGLLFFIYTDTEKGNELKELRQENIELQAKLETCSESNAKYVTQLEKNIGVMEEATSLLKKRDSLMIKVLEDGTNNRN